MKPRIFVSAVTKELRSARQIVANTLMALGYEPVWQDTFGMSGEDIRPMLRKKIDSCSAVLQIVGEAYGAEPPLPDETFGRVSYTQYEALWARASGKKIYYLIAKHNMPSDAPAESIDLPLGDSDEARADALRRRQLQQEYLASIQSTEHIFYEVQSHPEAELAVRRLKDELDRLRRGFKNWMIGVSTSLIAIVGGVIWLNWGQRDLVTSVREAHENTAKQLEAASKSTKEELNAVLETVKGLADPDALAEKIRHEIQAAAQSRIEALTDEEERANKIAAIEKERDQALLRVNLVVETIQWNLKQGAGTAYQNAASILQKEGVDAALEFLRNQRALLFEESRKHEELAKSNRERFAVETKLRNQTLQAVLLEADLLESAMRWESSLKLREEVATIAPDWFEARNGLGVLYATLARFPEAESHQQAALKIAENTSDEGRALNNLGNLLQDMNRLTEAEALFRRAIAFDEKSLSFDTPAFATHLENLARLLSSTSRYAEAERYYRRAFPIFEKHYGPKHVHVSTSLINLARLLSVTNRVSQAELLTRRALAIDEQIYGSAHPDVAIDLSHLATLLQDTSRAVEAEPLFRRAIEIEEQSFGPSHPRVAASMNVLGRVLQARASYFDAEPLHRRALLIGERAYGPGHPIVTVYIGNLAEALRGKNRLADAEPLIRLAMKMDAQAYGTENPKYAFWLNNLALLLQATNRQSLAEPLIRHGLAIREKLYGSANTLAADSLWTLSALLRDTDRVKDAVPLMRRALANYVEFKSRSGYEYPHWKTALGQYRDMLVRSGLTSDRITDVLVEATTSAETNQSLGAAVEQILGPTRSVEEVLVELDSQYKADGKPAIYFLETTEPLAPHLDTLLQPSPKALNSSAYNAYNKGAYAEAIVFYDEALKLKNQLAESPDASETIAIAEISRLGALSELGGWEQARDELLMLLSQLESDPETTDFSKGLARYHLIRCRWRLAEIEDANKDAEAWINEFGDVDRLSGFKTGIEQLISDLKDGSKLPSRPDIDSQAAIVSARKRYQAQVALGVLSLNESALPLLNEMLGSVGSTKDIIDALDVQYRKSKKSDLWFLPLDTPIASRLDELLGPVTASITTN